MAEITATFFEKQNDGTMKWLLVSMTGRHDIAAKNHEIPTKYATEQFIATLMAQHSVTAILPALKESIAPGVAKLKDELEKKE